MVLACIDVLTKGVELVGVSEETPEIVAEFLFTEVIPRHGCPQHLTSDGAGAFTARVSKCLYELMGMNQHVITSYRPCSDGPIERFFRTLKGILRKYIHTLGVTNWDKYLPYLRMAYHNTEHRITRFTPFFLMHGREMRMPIDAVMGTGGTLYRGLSEYREHLRAVVLQARRDAHASMVRQQITQTRPSQLPQYVTGDYVYLSVMVPLRGQSRVETVQWSGPYQVLRRMSDDSPVYVLDVRGKEVFAHSDRLRRWTMGPSQVTSWGVTAGSGSAVPPTDGTDLAGLGVTDVTGHVRVGDDITILDAQLKDSKELDVSAILDYRVLEQRSRTTPRVKQYLVKWRGFLDADNTWEPLDNLEGCTALIDRFWAARGRHRTAMEHELDPRVERGRSKQKESEAVAQLGPTTTTVTTTVTPGVTLGQSPTLPRASTASASIARQSPSPGGQDLPPTRPAGTSGPATRTGTDRRLHRPTGGVNDERDNEGVDRAQLPVAGKRLPSSALPTDRRHTKRARR